MGVVRACLVWRMDMVWHCGDACVPGLACGLRRVQLGLWAHVGAWVGGWGRGVDVLGTLAWLVIVFCSFDVLRLVLGWFVRFV